MTLPTEDPSAVDAPWWTSGLVGGALVATVAGIVFTTAVQVVVPALATPPATSATAEQRLDGPSAYANSAGTPDAPAGAEPPERPDAWADDEPGDQVAQDAAAETPASAEQPGTAAPAVATEPMEKPLSAEQVRAQRRKERLRRERRAARELAVIARQTFETWGPITATWVLPVEDYRLSAHYGETGPHWSTIHTGQDFAAPTGTPVRAASQGVVTFSGYDGPYGNKLEITHPDGTVTWYAHLSRVDVAESDAVQAGQTIGLVGATGNVTGPHLHFEVHPGGGDASDPAALFAEHGIRF